MAPLPRSGRAVYELLSFFILPLPPGEVGRGSGRERACFIRLLSFSVFRREEGPLPPLRRRPLPEGEVTDCNSIQIRYLKCTTSAAGEVAAENSPKTFETGAVQLLNFPTCKSISSNDKPQQSFSCLGNPNPWRSNRLEPVWLTQIGNDDVAVINQPTDSPAAGSGPSPIARGRQWL